MEEWPVEKKQRVSEVIKSLHLPETGEALDFGCGNGVFTNVIKQALPKWNVYGVDISSIAVENARKRYSDCSFFLPSDVSLNNKQFDFVLTHHVLEHVHDVSEAWRKINSYGKAKASILHILPCGNQGSFEYNLCMLRKDGIDRGAGGRFVFEDKGHIRRLTTKQVNDFAAQYDLELAVDYYSNQFYGALDWITSSSPVFILEMTNPRQAKDKISALKLIFLRITLLTIKVMRFPANTIDYKRNKMKKCKYYFCFLAFFLLYPFSKLMNIFFEHMSNLEWSKEKSKKNGSEMYLYYKRA
jgi:SAM-dependent methyltransferase